MRSLLNNTLLLLSTYIHMCPLAAAEDLHLTVSRGPCEQGLTVQLFFGTLTHPGELSGVSSVGDWVHEGPGGGGTGLDDHRCSNWQLAGKIPYVLTFKCIIIII